MKKRYVKICFKDEHDNFQETIEEIDLLVWNYGESHIKNVIDIATLIFEDGAAWIQEISKVIPAHRILSLSPCQDPNPPVSPTPQPKSRRHKRFRKHMHRNNDFQDNKTNLQNNNTNNSQIPQKDGNNS